ncbi:unnamed protein product [Sphenostylis stenocarpa]|uniref:Uncharacterized protein n=1 Tax=Sphenostylis stenocarpa TaxID=92480 RepID=A0AA86VKJ7_9FABA|nr:unnamed protein product [Sphenostylis stenocarpa]
MESGNGKSDKPLHVAMLPWLAMGHINPFFELAKILARKGHHVTFINSPKNIDRIPKPPKTLQPFITLVRLPLPRIQHLPEGAESTMDVPSTKLGFLKKALDGLQDSVVEVLKTSKPDWVFYDFTFEWLPEIAKSLNIPCTFYHITPAWNVSFFAAPKKQMNLDFSLKSMCGPPTWLPFRTSIHLRPYELMRAHNIPKDEETGERASFDINKAFSSCDLFLNRSCRELEGEWLDCLADIYNVPVIPVGVITPSMQIRDVEEENKNPDWRVALSQQDLTELAHGIELSDLPFFWAPKKLKEGYLSCQRGLRREPRIVGLFGRLGPLFKGAREKNVAMEVPRSEEDGSFTRDSVAKTLRFAIVDEDGSTLRENAKEISKIFGSEELHDQYIEDFIAALQKYSRLSSTSK